MESCSISEATKTSMTVSTLVNARKWATLQRLECPACLWEGFSVFLSGAGAEKILPRGRHFGVLEISCGSQSTPLTTDKCPLPILCRHSIVFHAVCCSSPSAAIAIHCRQYATNLSSRCKITPERKWNLNSSRGKKMLFICCCSSPCITFIEEYIKYCSFSQVYMRIESTSELDAIYISNMFQKDDKSRKTAS